MSTNHDDLNAALDAAHAAGNALNAELEAALGNGGNGGTDPLPPSDEFKILGMSSPKDQWEDRLEEVGAEGITARRIFSTPGDDQADLVLEAIEADLQPVYSFKTPDPADAARGGYDANVRYMIAWLDAFGVPISVTCHHEPHSDMAASDFVKMNERYLPMFEDSEFLEFGPFLNGWLLDNKVAEFKSYTSPTLLEGWVFVGIDTYEEGDMATQPGKILPGERIPKLVKFLKDEGHPGKLIRVGEYNGYSGNSISLAGEAMLDEPSLDMFLMWNSTEGKGYVLEGERLEAFKATKDDPRVAR
jgi:hypothetical protein